jgi:LasA protease
VYTVSPGDNLSWIAQRYGCTVEDLVRLNRLPDPDSLQPGQRLRVPTRVSRVGPALKLIPDSELVYSPAFVDFDIAAFVNEHNGFLKNYSEKVEGQVCSGTEIIQIVAQRFSVGPRLLLALLEYKGGWLDNPSPPAVAQEYPMGKEDPARAGLFLQTSWAANHLNEGYYGWQRGDLALLHFATGQRAQIARELNPGTVGVQNVLALASEWESWQQEVGPEGFIKVYQRLFGDPFRYAIEPLVPPDLTQPSLSFPWATGETWYYSAGPHPAWGDWSAWAALDFLPPGEGVGCWESPAWVTAPAPGLVIRSEEGMVWQDLDGDGYEQTGWVLFYLHIGSEGRVPAGTFLRLGDRVGHPSCAGGQATGTHVHLARRYNGQWMAASGPVPMVLSGWTVQPDMSPYQGNLVKGQQTRVPCECRETGKNDLTAPAP